MQLTLLLLSLWSLHAGVQAPLRYANNTSFHKCRVLFTLISLLVCSTLACMQMYISVGLFGDITHSLAYLVGFDKLC